MLDAAARFNNHAIRAVPGYVEPLLWSHGRACPGHPRLFRGGAAGKTWMPATSAGMTRGEQIQSYRELL